jgi:nucleoside-diphosphate-sugar epimerase
MTIAVAVLGASGGCGQQVVAQAHARGWRVTAMARPTSVLDVASVARVVRGEIFDAAALDDAIAGCRVVISCLGIRRRFPRNPWSRMLAHPDFTSTSGAAIVAAMRRTGVRELVAISAGGVGDSAPGLSWPLRVLFGRSKIGVAYRDLAAMEAVYAAAAGLRCLVARPVTLRCGPVAPVREVARFGLFASISRASVAAWMLDRIAADEVQTRCAQIAR